MPTTICGKEWVYGQLEKFHQTIDHTRDLTGSMAVLSTARGLLVVAFDHSDSTEVRITRNFLTPTENKSTIFFRRGTRVFAEPITPKNRGKERAYVVVKREKQ